MVEQEDEHKTKPLFIEQNKILFDNLKSQVNAHGWLYIHALSGSLRKRKRQNN